VADRHRLCTTTGHLLSNALLPTVHVTNRLLAVLLAPDAGTTRDTLNRRNRARCLKCGVIESKRQIVGQDTVDVKAAEGVSGGVSGGAVAATAVAEKLYEITVRFRDGSTTVLNEASPCTWRLGNRVIVIGRSNAENN
jgi:outer membrane lipoprotein SlyB